MALPDLEAFRELLSRLDRGQSEMSRSYHWLPAAAATGDGRSCKEASCSVPRAWPRPAGWTGARRQETLVPRR
jgi:hypothetical protein